MYTRAVQYIRPMEQGWTQPHLFKCDDNHTYVVKFINNHDGTGVLANEWIAYRLGKLMHLAVAQSSIVMITDDLLDMYPKLKKLNIPSGPHIGSRFARYGVNLGEEIDLSECMNIHHAAGMIVFDHWINNWDRHITQANLLYLQDKKEILLIDHSDAFFGPGWNLEEWFENSNDIHVFWGSLYERFVPFIDNSDPFDYYLSIIESLNEHELRQAIQGIPSQWDIPEDELHELIDFLLLRKDRVRDVLKELIEYFPIWSSTERDW